MYLKTIITAIALFATMSGPILADYYPPNLSAQSRDQHEFRDVQRGSFPTGPTPSTITPSVQDRTSAPDPSKP